MTKVTINPGVCGFVTTVEAIGQGEDNQDVKLVVHSGCEPVMNMFTELGDTFDSFELCLVRPGKGPLYEYAAEKFPPHCACPVPAGITKAAEAECRLALPRDSWIKFDAE